MRESPRRHASRTNGLPRVVIADDHAVVAEGLCSILQKSCNVIGIVRDGRELLAEAPKLRPDLIVLDIGMPALNGLDAAEQLMQVLPNVKFVFLTMKDDPNLAAAALNLGKVGYVLKHSLSSELLHAVSEVLQGNTYVTPRLRSEDWARIRIGVGPDEDAASAFRRGKDYLLMPMRKADLATLDEVLDRVAQAVEVVAAKGVKAAMNEFNRRDNGREQNEPAEG